MTAMERYQSGSLTSRESRRVNRELDHLEAVTSLRLARLEKEAQLQAAMVSAMVYVGRRAMEDVALLSQVEQSLAQAVPHASGRLAAIADLTAIAASEIVADTVRQLRR